MLKNESPDLWDSHVANVSEATGYNINEGTKNKNIERAKDIKSEALMMKIAMYGRR